MDQDNCPFHAHSGKIKHWYLHNNEKRRPEGAEQKPNDPTCGFLHSFPKCKEMYFMVHKAVRKARDGGDNSLDWMLEPIKWN